MAEKIKVAEEVAAAEFSRMCATFRIDEDTSELGEADLKEWNELRGRIIKDICRGRVVVDGEGQPVVTTESGKAITFHRPTGATVIALETHKEKNISNSIAAIGDMTRTNPSEFSRMFLPDFRTCSRLASLFLADE